MIVAPNSFGSVYLDLIRGVAALAVFVGHLRSLYVVDFAQAADQGIAAKGFYLLTAFGHQAVIVFFVLSGFLIASSVTRRLERWSWREYLLDRLARLHVVLIPALIATAAWDTLGLHTGRDQTIYLGTARTNAIQFPVAERLTLSDFVASACYCQTILAPPFGSNAPLWSLANEFWYYILFPALALTACGGSVRERLVSVAIAVAVAAFVGPGILTLFPVWLMGAAVQWLGPLWSLGSRRYRVLGGLATGAVVGILLLTAAHQLTGLAGDYLLGGAIAVWVYATASDTRPVNRTRATRTFQAVALGLAGFSYTLYLTHFPILVYIRSQLASSSRWQLGPEAFAWLSVIFAGGLLYAWGFSRVTEGQTARVRRWLRKRLVPPNVRVDVSGGPR